MRSFDELAHSYLGYVLRIEGTCSGEVRESLIAFSGGAHVKHRSQAGIELAAASVSVEDPCKKTDEFYKTSWLMVLKNAQDETHAGRLLLGCLLTWIPTGVGNIVDWIPWPTRKVPGRKDMCSTEEDWGDEDASSYRGPDA